MVFNMVANQSTGPVRDHKGLSAALIKLRVEKDKKRVSNLPEWKESLQNAFVTHNLGGFLREKFGQQVPPDQVGSILINEEDTLVVDLDTHLMHGELSKALTDHRDGCS